MGTIAQPAANDGTGSKASLSGKGSHGTPAVKERAELSQIPDAGERFVRCSCFPSLMQSKLHYVSKTFTIVRA